MNNHKKVIDLTHVFSSNMPVYEFDESPILEQTRNLKENKYNDWRLTSGMHIGTHIDGPGHLTDSKLLLSDIPVYKFVGKGYLVDARNKTITAQLLADMPNEPGLIVLIVTGWDKKFGSKEYLLIIQYWAMILCTSS